MATEEGLRALKKRRTRRDIVVATLELTLEDSYRATTIPQIAERATVSPRTVSIYFPSKDEIAFDGMAETIVGLEEWMRRDDLPLVDRLRRWIYERSPRDEEVDELRVKALAADPDLRLIEHRYLDRMSEIVATAVAEELGDDPRGPGPQTFAAAYVGVLLALRDRLGKGDPSGPPGGYLEVGFNFLESGLATLRAESVHS